MNSWKTVGQYKTLEGAKKALKVNSEFYSNLKIIQGGSSVGFRRSWFSLDKRTKYKLENWEEEYKEETMKVHNESLNQMKEHVSLYGEVIA